MSKNVKHPEHVAAVLTLRGVPTWTKRERKDIELWLRRLGNTVITTGHNLGPVFVAKYFCRH